MPWKELSKMDERMRFIARLTEGEKMAVLCREFDISRKTGYKLFSRFKNSGIEGLTDRSRRPYRHANRLPFQIENLILQHPAVENVACVPIPDATLGERMCACVILRPGRTLTLEELVAFLTEKEIARYKLPERLETMGDFPLSTFGKVSKKSLVETITTKLAMARL